ncbi:MAG: MBL fold metallo-hydrolase [Firmicutes bacterium]|nr:MBL fold metallo-hydrolase [Bacillota bacterium]
MNIGFMALSSGSSGNCYLIRTEKTKVLLDLGISCRSIKTLLAGQGLELKDIDAIFISHEHSDHIKGVKTTMKNTDCPLYASHGTLSEIVKKASPLPYERLIEMEDGEAVKVGPDLTVRSFRVSHDAKEPFQYSFEAGGKKVSVVTDTGFVSDEILHNIEDSDILALEANHERNILLYGSYPFVLKMRILSDVGHLSNESCAHTVVEILKRDRHPKIFLAHLSQENNTPEQAMITVKNGVEEAGFAVGRDLELRVIKRGDSSEYVTV